ncbi:MAG: hypothetical protein WD066_20545 [Planctomycetaceae bacterium]
MLRSFVAIVLIGAACVAAAAEEPAEAPNRAAGSLVERIRELDGRVLLRGMLSRNPMAEMLPRFVAAELREANRRDRAEWRAVESKEDWERMRERRLKALRDSLGRFPDVPEDPKVRVVGTVAGDGFEVANIVYETRPGVVVTANLYRPAGAKSEGPRPGVIIALSHQQPKETGARQLMGATWARAGCLVLVPDHIGHGERRQHPFRTEADHPEPFRMSGQDYYFRYDNGIQLHLIGDSLMGWLVWDLRRGIDVLLDQPEVDPERIVMISEPAGGGDVAAVTAALDERIVGVMVNNFGGPEPENGYPLPPDAEEWFPYTSSGSWESTRNLTYSVRDGFLPWTIVASIAPRRLIYYHEFYWDRERDPVWKRLRKVHEWRGAADSLTGMEGHGFVVGSSPENTHWTPESRKLLYPTLERWFGIPNPGEEYDRSIPVERLHCLTSPEGGRVRTVPLHRLCAQLGTERVAVARRELAALSPKERVARLRETWAELLGGIDSPDAPLVRKAERSRLGEVAVERIQLGTEPGIVVPVLLLVPPGDAPRRTIVAVAQAGKQAFLRERNEEIAKLLESGTALCLIDVRGTGETDPGDDRGRLSESSAVSSSALMLGRPILGARLRDLRQVVRYLRVRDDVHDERIVLWGDNFAPVNAADREFVVPHAIAGRPYQSEPLGGMLALLAALFDERIEAVYVHGGLSGFHDVLGGPVTYLPHDMVVPGALTAGDLCDVAAAIAPRPLFLGGLVDGFNRRLDAQRCRVVYEPAIASYRRANAERQLVIADDGPSLSIWLPAISSTAAR